MAPDRVTTASASNENERPDRPILPLPKRRLRERLSPEVADSIQYPPAPQSASALFSYPCSLKGSIVEEDLSSSSRESELAGRQGSRRHGASAEGESYGTSPRRIVVPRPPTESLGRPARLLQRPEPARQVHSPQPPPSAASSADGYESFENTNNKKRKIPTAGEMLGAHGLGDHDKAGENGSSTSALYYSSGSSLLSGQNISGPGRGRFGRVRTGRTPLQALSEVSGNWVGRASKTRSSNWSPQPAQSTGIISNAIANAEKLVAPGGQENTTSLLQQPSPAKPTPSSTQFTFTCDSQVPGSSLSWPGAGPKVSSSAPAEYDPPVRSYPHPRVRPSHQKTVSSASAGSAGSGVFSQEPTSDCSMEGQASESATQERKQRRRADRDLQQQARKRREETARQNILHGHKHDEDDWICEFCEYELIFGYPPYALIRQYEIKDRKARQQEEERRRVWEKAKARSRKGKKTKAPSKAQVNNNNNLHNQANDAHQVHPTVTTTHSQGTQSEPFDDDDEYEAEGNYELDSEPTMLKSAEKNHAAVPGRATGPGPSAGPGRKPNGGTKGGRASGARAAGVEASNGKG
ncbi:hypothetical protein M406DRAFT_344744 [Cryphonectria parasitica EP155]|uniref:Uncharacterized protein n=1 Tax=Cryphonectria parasitica (strain ATCC 38755 / EP155) TaxID=660469 RepID=A0A9P5CT16_CRYP1|nr:uncharacterized protein M406DRAFT_344744 [Cryphonectria parasitica EP155]KAF3768680.1 hypothetical protein M406DRAFT_344744 [Cryphonectria parasitica EP155]